MQQTGCFPAFLSVMAVVAAIVYATVTLLV